MAPASGNGFTVTFTIALTVPQPFVTEYDIGAVPEDTPVTTPVEPTVAANILPLLHTPPVVASDKPVVDDTQTTCVPLIVPGFANGFTVIAFVTVVVPHAFVTE
jgi:hypothetical protein